MATRGNGQVIMFYSHGFFFFLLFPRLFLAIAEWLSTILPYMRSTELCTMFGRLVGCYTIYTFLEGSCPITEFCQVKNSLRVQALRSPIFAALLHGIWAMGISQTLRRGTRNGIAEIPLLVFNRGRRLYSEVGHHVVYRPTFYSIIITIIKTTSEFRNVSVTVTVTVSVTVGVVEVGVVDTLRCHPIRSRPWAGWLGVVTDIRLNTDLSRCKKRVLGILAISNLQTSEIYW